MVGTASGSGCDDAGHLLQRLLLLSIPACAHLHGLHLQVDLHGALHLPLTNGAPGSYTRSDKCQEILRGRQPSGWARRSDSAAEELSLQHSGAVCCVHGLHPGSDHLPKHTRGNEICSTLHHCLHHWSHSVSYWIWNQLDISCMWDAD